MRVARLSGKVAFITGAGAGIARVAAEIFAREGAKVALAEIKPEAGRETERIVCATGGEAKFVETDVTREESVRAAIADAIRFFGKIDVIFNCAGGSLPEDSLVTDVDLSVWDRTISVNLLGTILCCRHGIPRLIDSGGGAVVNMSSGAALRGASPAHIYTAAKGAILSLTRALAGAYAKHGVRANAICAGRIMTERIVSTYGTPDVAGPVVDRQDPAGRATQYPLWVGQPVDIANIALFLASDESRMITGASIAADGGRSAY